MNDTPHTLQEHLAVLLRIKREQQLANDQSDIDFGLAADQDTSWSGQHERLTKDNE
jgi:hypothetical protein